VDWYFYRAIKIFTIRSSVKKGKIIKYLYLVFSLLSILFLFYVSYFYIAKTEPPKFARIYLVGFLFITFISKLLGSLWIMVHDVTTFFSYITKQIKKQDKNSLTNLNDNENKTTTVKKISRKEFLKKAAVITAFLPFSSLMYGVLRTAFNFKIKKKNVPIKNLPNNLKGLKIVQISDIHTGSFISDAPLKNVVKMVNELNPDIVFFTGDLVNEIAEEALQFIDVLKHIKAKYGVYSILGNHDYGDYYYAADDVEGKQHNKKLITEIHKKLGWRLLLNEHAIIEINKEKLAIVGVENWGAAHRFPKYGDLDKAIANLNPQLPTILLSHDPSHWDIMVKKSYPQIDLTLSGHTHGMQFGIEIPGFKWSPAKYLYKQWAGLYSHKHQHIYVNRGIGFIGYPGRVGIAPEITLLELS
jgi:hypothetical protein